VPIPRRNRPVCPSQPRLARKPVCLSNTAPAKTRIARQTTIDVHARVTFRRQPCSRPGASWDCHQRIAATSHGLPARTAFAGVSGQSGHENLPMICAMFWSGHAQATLAVGPAFALWLGLLVPVRQQYSCGIARGIVILLMAQSPDEGAKPHKAEKQRNGDHPDQDVHGYFIRMALSETVIDDSDIAIADISGVANPSRATGTAMTL
jgi:hypothetical protein